MGIITLVLSQRILIEDPTKSIVNCSRELSIACTGILIFIRIPFDLHAFPSHGWIRLPPPGQKAAN